MKLFPPKPTRAWAGTDFHEELVRDPIWIVERKMDGDRCLVVIGKDGVPELWNRHGAHTRYDWLTNLRKQLKRWDLPEGLIFDCELMHEPKPNQDLWIFDCPTVEGDLKTRKGVLKDLFAELPRSCKLIHLVKPMAKRDAYEKALREGQEGVVWKRTDSKYVWQTGATAPTVSYWIKMKPAQAYK